MKKVIFAAVFALVPAAGFAGDYGDEGYGTSSVNFGVTGSTFGDITGSGSPTTNFNAGKSSWLDVASSLDGIGCLNCEGTYAEGYVNTGESGFLEASTYGDDSGEVYGNSGHIVLGATGQITGGDDSFGFQSKLGTAGEVLGVGVGDEVHVTTVLNQWGSASGTASYKGSPCNVGNPCQPDGVGDANVAAWSSGGVSALTSVSARGKNPVAISNSSFGTVSSLLGSGNTQ